MTARLRLPILIAALVPALAVGAVWGLSAAAAPLAPDAKCQKPQVKSKMVYGREKVSYDLERQPNYRAEGKPLGWYYATDEVSYRMQLQGGCLKSLDITIKVFPVIQLRSIYKKKTKKCARKSILEHERRHSAVAKREFKKLGNDIKKVAIRLFTGKSAPDPNTVAAALNGELEKGLYKRFRKKYKTAQDGFHDDLKQARIIRKKCRLVKRKRY